jgi:hypothetical protein
MHDLAVNTFVPMLESLAKAPSAAGANAYDILRHNGVQIGKQDYASQVGALIRRK